MKNKLFALIFVAISQFASAQFFEDFSSQSLSTNNWQGDITRYKISTSTAIPGEMRPALQLDDVVANTSVLSAPFSPNFSDSLEWNFWIKFSFMATTNNHARVYVVSDQLNTAGSLNGYFIGIGETDKRLTLVKQTGAALTTLITGNVANLTSTTNTLRIKLVRNTSGVWKLYSDSNGGFNWNLEGSATDLTYTSSAWHGLYSKYTVSNSTKIYFDEFYVGSVIVDTIKPFVTGVSVISQLQLDVSFSEKVDSVDAMNVSNYFVSNAIGNPLSITKSQSTNGLYHLTFINPFPENTSLNLNVQNIKDLAANTMLPQDIPFAYYVPKAYDILITEIMADPTPVVGLPEFEYIELYNRSSLPINLNNWKISFGSNVRTFPNISIAPNSYLIVCGASAESAFLPYGQVYAFSSIAITNDGQSIVLTDNQNNLIHKVIFTIDWYKDNSKKDGGWSLEMIDTNNPCGESENWLASVNSSGGTPGTLNSVNAQNPDVTKPSLVRVSVENPQTIRLWFSETMDSLKLLNPASYQFSHNLNVVGQPRIVFPTYKSVILDIDQALQKSIIYSLTVVDTLFDCVGNMIEINSSAKFALADSIHAGDIIINEILSNPPTGAADFVEVYNKSNKVLDLKDLNLTTIDRNSGELSSIRAITENSFLIFPGDHIVLTTKVDELKSIYYCPFPNNFIKMSSLPAYNNDDGFVVLANKANVVIDRVDYIKAMHFPMLSTTKGVSLERINYLRPSNDVTNWISASETSGFATPGYKNSQYSDVIFEGEVNVDPEIFSPDNDGYNDILNINYSFPKPAYVATITIFDARGKIIKNLIKNELLGTSGTYSWNGITNDNQKAPIGIYIVYFEVFDIDGNKNSYKMTAVLGGFLNR